MSYMSDQCSPSSLQTLQFIADSIKVIANSSNDFEKPDLPKVKSTSTNAAPVYETPKRSQTFDAFGRTEGDAPDGPSPSKKAKPTQTKSQSRKGKEKADDE